MAMREIKTALAEGETVVRQGRANLQRGIEAVGGWLYLTTERLIFESHRFNVQSGTTEIPLASISAAGKCWTRFLGRIPTAPNSIQVRTHDGAVHRFTVWGRARWLKAIGR